MGAPAPALQQPLHLVEHLGQGLPGPAQISCLTGHLAPPLPQYCEEQGSRSEPAPPRLCPQGQRFLRPAPHQLLPVRCHPLVLLVQGLPCGGSC